MSKQTDFIAKYSGTVIAACEGTGIFPSVKMAQMILETGWGKSKVGNNMFGIKAQGKKSPYWNGSAINADTTEFIQGESGTYNLAFRKYASIESSIRDHTHFLQNNKRYAENGVFTAKTPEEQAAALQKAGYATAPNYASSLINVITAYNLKSLDEKKKL
ncbi:MAG TPA: glucosaminidase domain-containing protein [Bacteroidales bacterium]|nr:glucosaminidase domain-containing protein [Bacteroidales bacterium]HQN16682.1 glucosaminidase domain-containing protein [Bacteroidales bacterium]HQP16248.1 glucosaminidase domain-containing protein [Bacteroidales bacterium]